VFCAKKISPNPSFSKRGKFLSLLTPFEKGGSKGIFFGTAKNYTV
jgi:hypothetical protein